MLVAVGGRAEDRMEASDLTASMKTSESRLGKRLSVTYRYCWSELDRICY